ncbi:molybdopterin-dependent oxidoreductase, partial [Mesorhizobium sp. M4B.F.Ca.ET.049.02.1.2]|uniref:molybdopterin-dependent oxidoreductase n=1 Tax=Mesorhizobium sp. M4B.F.Ca.ET.049.02.1.2 TaxID=2496752 RepID=UPI001FE229CB
DPVRHAHVSLPATAWGEKDGTVTNSERRISRQRPFLAAPGEARPDWWIVAEVAKRMGFAEAFAHAAPAEIFAEHAALSGYENDGARDFDIGAHAGINAEGYEDLAPFQWPAPALSSPLRGGSESALSGARQASRRGGGGEVSVSGNEAETVAGDPLWPAGHLPLKKGDQPAPRPSPISKVREWAQSAVPLVSPLEGEMAGRPE